MSRMRRAPEAGREPAPERDGHPTYAPGSGVADSAADTVLGWQVQAGNGAVARLLSGAGSPAPDPRIQFKLTVGASGDPLEREADRVADLVVDGPGVAAPVPASSTVDGTAGAAAPPVAQQALGGSGRPLPAATRARLGPAFGHDFGDVRVHTRAADAVGARAYTMGTDIVFGGGQYAPGTAEGDRLLAHELTHTVQQSGAGTAGSTVRRKEVDADAQVAGARDWTTADRVGNTQRWKDACLTNLRAADSSQYVKVVERRDFYHWFYEYSASLGFGTRWALAAYVVANGAHQIADMDIDHALANDVQPRGRRAAGRDARGQPSDLRQRPAEAEAAHRRWTAAGPGRARVGHADPVRGADARRPAVPADVGRVDPADGLHRAQDPAGWRGRVVDRRGPGGARPGQQRRYRAGVQPTEPAEHRRPLAVRDGPGQPVHTRRYRLQPGRGRPAGRRRGLHQRRRADDGRHPGTPARAGRVAQPEPVHPDGSGRPGGQHLPPGDRGAADPVREAADPGRPQPGRLGVLDPVRAVRVRHGGAGDPGAADRSGGAAGGRRLPGAVPGRTRPGRGGLPADGPHRTVTTWSRG